MVDDYMVTRKLGKAHTLPSAPAYSFGGRHERAQAEPGPGPGAYSPGWDLSNKGAGFGTSNRDAWRGSGTPAGTDYRPSDQLATNSKPAYSFGGTTKSKPQPMRNTNPGPGAYEPRSATDMVKPAASSYSLAFRSPGSREAERVPAPNAYDPRYPPHEVHTPSLKGRHNVPSTSGPTPGPGEYNTQQRRPHSEGKTFGVSRDAALPDNRVPGPGEYGAPDPVRERRAAWSVGRASRDGLRVAPGPGPGAYSPNSGTDGIIPREGGHAPDSAHRSAPAYTFGGRTEGSRPPSSPGPADFGTPGDPGRNAKPAYSLRPAAKRGGASTATPGPGHYSPDHSLVRHSANSKSLAFRTELPGAWAATPGPNAYAPRSPDARIAVSLKSRHTVGADNRDNPAPHDYADKDLRGFGSNCCDGCGRKGFTMRPRYPEFQREGVPGPQYAIGASTLGVAAEPQMLKSKIPQTLVL